MRVDLHDLEDIGASLSMMADAIAKHVKEKEEREERIDELKQELAEAKAEIEELREQLAHAEAAA